MARLLIAILLLGTITCLIDYLRINSNQMPIFSIVNYNEKTKKQTFRGLFYIIERKVTISNQESIKDSKNISFKVLTFDLKIKEGLLEKRDIFQLDVKESANCNAPSSLLYSSANIKVYTYCLDSVDVSINEKKESLLSYFEKKDSAEEFLSKLLYNGLASDHRSYIYSDYNKLITQNGLKVYECNTINGNKDIYIGPDTLEKQPDFCINKDDDFKFLYQIVDESPIKEESSPEEVPETFYEDNDYFYQFPYKKSAYVFLETPALRGFPSKKIPLIQALQENRVTIDSLEKKGLKFEKLSKQPETP